MKKLLMFTALAFVMAAPASSFAEDAKEGPRPHKGEMLEKIDTDKDGAISKEEFTAFHLARFDEMDLNHDGKITKEEGEAKRAEWKEKIKEMKAKRDAEKAQEAPAADAPAAE